MPDHSTQIDSLLESATLINSLVCSGILIAAIVFVKRLMGKSLFSLKLLDLELPLDKAWIVILFFTIAHYFTSFYITRSCDRILTDATYSIAERDSVWKKLTQTDFKRFIFSEMEPRRRIGTVSMGSIGFFEYYNIEQSDLAGILSYAFILLIFFSIAHYNRKEKKKFIFYNTIAIILCITNWAIGSWWAVKCSELAL